MRHTSLLRTTAAFVATTALWVAYTQQAAPPEELKVVRVTDDLHVIEGSGGNVAVYRTGDGVILVDDKFERNVPHIMDNVKSLTKEPIRYVLNTHQHGDHTGGNAKLQASGIETVSHENARLNMTKGSMPGLPRITFAGTMAVHLGGKEVRAQYFGRGHTNGDAIIYFPALRTIHTGDLFVAGAPFIDYGNGGSGKDWPETLNRALALDFDTVIPGHGPVMKKADLLTWKKSFEVARSRIEEAQRQGVTKEQAAERVKVDDLPGWGGSSRFWGARSLPGFWDELRR